MTGTQLKLFVGVVIFVFVLLISWVLFVPPYNVPKFENIENNQTGFLIPLDTDTTQQAQFESAAYLKDKKVAAKRVQIHKRWVQRGWLYTTGEYLDIERLITVDRSPVIKEWTDSAKSGTSPNDESISAQSKDGSGLKLNFTCTSYIPEADKDHPEGAEHFLYYYKGETLGHVMDKEVRARVQAVAAEFTAQYPLETLRGTQHKLVEAVREDVVPFFKKRGIAITSMGMVGGFHYTNEAIQKSIDDAIKAQQLKIVAMAQQEKEKIEQQTKLYNQEINNKTLKLKAEGEVLALQAKLEGEAKAKLAAAKVDAEAVKVTAEAEAYKYQQLDQYKHLVMALKTLEMEQAWRMQWQGGVPQTVFGSSGSIMPIFPFGNLTGVHLPSDASKLAEKKEAGR
jgi:hypothetical protein